MDAPFGPAVETGTRLHRVEHALLAAVLAGVLAWLIFWERRTDPWRALGWLVMPDLVFIPIAIASRSRGGRWPAWGAALYNASHSYVTMLASWAISSGAAGHLVLPMLAWALHIELDRALGFDLRRTG